MREGDLLTIDSSVGGPNCNAFAEVDLSPCADVGEFSAITWADGADRYIADCISLFNEHGFDWTYHAFREWPGWSVEHECEAPGGRFRPSSDNPRLRVLRAGLLGPRVRLQGRDVLRGL